MKKKTMINLATEIITTTDMPDIPVKAISGVAEELGVK